MRIYTCRGGPRSSAQTLEEVQSKIQSGELLPTDLAWYDGAADWMPLAQVPGVTFPAEAAAPRLKIPPPLRAVARSQSRSSTSPSPSTPPPPMALLVVGGVGAIILAVSLFGVGLNMLMGKDWPVVGLLLLPGSIGVGVASLQFFQALRRNPIGCCKVCGQYKPTISGSLNRHIGAVILMFHAHISGYMCKDCIGRIFWQFTPLTLAAGWWGFISFFVTPVVLVNNVAYYLRSRFMK